MHACNAAASCVFVLLLVLTPTHSTDRPSNHQVKKHKTVEAGIWVTYQGNVYDITEFSQNHPGQSGLDGRGGWMD